MITAATALALNLDVEVASYVANNALKNNMELVAALAARQLVVAGLRTHVGLAILQALSIATLTEQAKDGPLKDFSEREWQSLADWWRANQGLEGGGATPLPKDIERALGGNGPATMWMVLNEMQRISEKVGIKDTPAQPKVSAKPTSPAPQAPMPGGLEPDDKDKGKSDPKPKNPNQLNQEIQRGQAPKGIARIDRGSKSVKGEQTHVHFDNGNALNIDGTWKHGQGIITKAQREWLIKNGWKINE